MRRRKSQKTSLILAVFTFCVVCIVKDLWIYTFFKFKSIRLKQSLFFGGKKIVTIFSGYTIKFVPIILVFAKLV
jgi:hypothetical protein